MILTAALFLRPRYQLVAHLLPPGLPRHGLYHSLTQLTLINQQHLSSRVRAEPWRRCFPYAPLASLFPPHWGIISFGTTLAVPSSMDGTFTVLQTI